MVDDSPSIKPEMGVKSAKEVGASIISFASPDRTYLIAVAIHKEKNRNTIERVSCKNGLPIGGYIYDAQNDTYHIECVDYLHLGFVPVSFIGRIVGVSNWEVRLPMPEFIIKKYLTTMQKKELRQFRKYFKPEDFDIQFIQMIDPN